ncbi:MAG: 50S ribosomal protein L22 [Patescibacteria group bacterium]|jgi:large subunit ribosomal protein L22
MDITAKLRNLRIAPRKVRLIADLVRGRSVESAVAELQFWQKRAAEPIRKLIESAIANAEHNFKVKTDNLVIKSITVNDAVTMKRSLPRAFGRATPIRKRGSHVILVLAEREPSVKQAKVVAVSKAKVKAVKK